MKANNIEHDEFLISKETLARLVENNHTCTQPFFEHIVSALKTNIDSGITGDQNDLQLRRTSFGSNFTFQPPSPQVSATFKRLLFDAFRDTTILLLLCCAALSLVIGIKTNGPTEAIIDVALIFLATSFVLTFGAAFRFFKTRFKNKKLNLKKAISVVRNGNFFKISEYEVVVGDIVHLETGDRVPADGMSIDDTNHGFLFSGSEVVNRRMLVTAVGESTERNRLMGSIGIEQKLQLLEAIDEHNSKLEKIWLTLSIVLLLVQLIRCFVRKPVQTDKDRNVDAKGVRNTMEDLMNESIRMMKREGTKARGLVAMLCILLFATRDGLPLALFISLVYASRKMKSCEANIQKLPESATVGLITTICTGKTSDLALEYPKMAEFWIGCSLVENNLVGEVDGGILDVLREGVFVHDPRNGCLDETSLIAWARVVLGNHFGFRDCSIVKYEGHGKGRNVNCSIIKRVDKVLHVNWKGPPEVILSMCAHYYTPDGKIETLDDNTRIAFLHIIQHLVACSQRCFAFAYKREIHEEEEEEDGFIKNLKSDLTLVGLVGMKNPYSVEVREAIEDCRRSEVGIKLMVEDDVNTARIMAVNSGILRPEEDDDGAIIEASDFRKSSEEDRMKMIDNIHVMANASPVDKLLLVQCLRRKGEIVAATASSTRDSPVLREAEVGLFMGEDLCKDGDILVVNRKFSQIPAIINLGRRVCKNLEKFIQLQLTLEISTFAVNIISVAVNSEDSSLSSFQFLWITLIVEILGALAVAVTTVHTQWSHTEGGSRERVYGSGPVITRSMCRTIAVQSVFQVSFILILEMKGKAIFRVKGSALKTMVFNCCVFFQVFSLMTAIELDGNGVVLGLFTGKSCLFLGIVAVIGILQVAVVEIMVAVAHWSKLDIKQWCVCIGVASFSVPLNSAANWVSQ